MIRIFGIFTLFMLLAFAATGHAAKRVALVIGNAAYKHAPLKNPVNDANDMASALKSLDFSVTLLKNADHETMERTIDAFGRKLEGSDIGIFYFAGHGAEVDGSNYLFPVNANVNNEADVIFRAVNAGYVLAEMEASGARTSIVILDACRNNPFTRRFRSASRGLAMMDAPMGSLIAFSTAPGELAEDGTGRNGIYTKHLLKHLNTPGLTLRDVMLRTRIGVANDTDRKQIPWDASSLMAEVYLAGEIRPGAPQTASVPPAPVMQQSKHRTWTEPITGMEFVWIPGGCFMMGSKIGHENTRPVHEVCVDGFWMGKYEVTNEQFRKYDPNHKSVGTFIKSAQLDGDRQPVASVTWQSAREFAKWLSRPQNGTIRLPTEAEWEYAARGGTQTELYWGENDGCKYANIADQSTTYQNPTPCNDGFRFTSPVGSYIPNDFGLYDMIGNVFEYCHDTYIDDAYSKHDRKNPLMEEDSDMVVARGGSWDGQLEYFNVSVRGGIGLKVKAQSHGFRLVREK